MWEFRNEDSKEKKKKVIFDLGSKLNAKLNRIKKWKNTVKF